MTRNFALLLYGFQRALVKATGQFIRENAELILIVNEEVEDLRRFHKRQTKATRTLAAREWDSTVRSLKRHCPDLDPTDLPNPFKEGEPSE